MEAQLEASAFGLGLAVALCYAVALVRAKDSRARLLALSLGAVVLVATVVAGAVALAFHRSRGEAFPWSSVVLYAGVFSLVGLLAAFLSPKARLARKVHEMPRSLITDLADGATCKIVGKLVPCGETLNAPFSGRACVYFEVAVSEHRGGRNGTWETLLEEARALDFYVDDGSGLALVRASAPGVEFVVVKDREADSNAMQPATPAFEAFLDRHRLTSKGEPFDHRLSCREGVLRPGETVVVRGLAQLEAIPALPGAAAARLSIGRPPDRALLVSDDPALL